jgi:hypothetical protein
MPMPAQPEHGPLSRAALRLLALIVVGPTVAMAVLMLLYAWSDRQCERGSGPLWTLLSGAALLVAASFAWLWRRRRALTAHPQRGRPFQERELFLTQVGLALNVVSLLLVISFASPLLHLRPCQ